MTEVVSIMNEEKDLRKADQNAINRQATSRQQALMGSVLSVAETTNTLAPKPLRTPRGRLDAEEPLIESTQRIASATEMPQKRLII